MHRQPLAAKFYDWLLAALSDWQQAGLIDVQQAQAITACYTRRDAKPWMTWILVLLAALLIGGGVILLLAHNWHELGRLSRALIALVPLLLMQGVCVLFAWRGKGHSVAGEACAIGLAAAQGAAIALVSQTYHLYGELWQFYLLWLLMALPSAMLLRSRALFVAAMVLLCALAVSAPSLYRDHISDTFLLWQTSPAVFAAATLALLFAVVYAYAVTGQIERWAVLLALPFVLSLVLSYPEEHSIALIALVYYGLGLWHDARGWQNPLRRIGSLGVVLLLLLMIFADSWFLSRATNILSVWLVGVVFLLSVFALWRKRAAALGQISTWVMLLTPCVFMLSNLLHPQAHALAHYLLTHSWILCAALLITYGGLHEDRLLKTNVGLLLLVALLLDVFFDSGWSMLVRGVGFIVCGVVLLLINLWLLRRRRA